jgi:NADH-quinone oxidoreductase subunit K
MAMGGITDMTIGLSHFLTVAAILFVLGIFGIFLNRKNVIVILMSVELILLSVNLNLVAFSAHLNDMAGQVVYFRNRGSIEVEDISTLKG